MAFEFTSASTDKLGYGDLAALDSLTAITIAVSFHISSLPSAIRGVYGKWGSSGGHKVTILSTNKLQLAVSNGTTIASLGTSAALAANTPYHAVLAWDATLDTMDIFLNGVLENTGAVANIAATNNNTGVVTIGNDPSSPTARAFPGQISSVMVWNVRLTRNEMASLYAGGLPRPASLVFWSPCLFKAQPDLIGKATATETGSVVEVDTKGVRVAMRPTRRHVNVFPLTITLLTKVINEEEQIPEANNSILGLLKIINEEERLVEAALGFVGILKIISDQVQVRDGDNNDLFDPAGAMRETMSDGTIWTKVYPPFIRRTKWTNA